MEGRVLVINFLTVAVVCLAFGGVIGFYVNGGIPEVVQVHLEEREANNIWAESEAMCNTRLTDSYRGLKDDLRNEVGKVQSCEQQVESYQNLNDFAWSEVNSLRSELRDVAFLVSDLNESVGGLNCG